MSVPALLLVALLNWGFWGSLFEKGPAAPAGAAVEAALASQLRTDGARLHPATRALYAARPGVRWTRAAERRRAAAALGEAPLDGLDAAPYHGAEAAAVLARLAAAEAAWAALDDDARDTLADPRPALLARADVLLSDGALRLGDALRGRRADPARLYPGTWFPTVRDSSGAGLRALAEAVGTGRAARVADALDGLRPQQAGYRRLRARLAALQADLAPVPSGPALRVGGHSVRVPHLRARLAALGYLGADTLGAGWERPDPFLYDTVVAGGLARFELAQRLPVNRVLEDADAHAINADPAALRRTLALNLERWRWLPDSLGTDYVWVNLPAFELRVFHADRGRTAEALRMPANIGNAQTTGWTTPVLMDSVHTVEFQPAWYVPASLAPSLFAQARADSLALWRQGVDVTLNGRPVDSRLVLWDSVSSAGFRYVQRPGASNPLGRVKFLMHNPYAILIHDTNKRYTLDDGAGSSMSSGCVQAGAPDRLAEYLLTTVNGWAPGEAEAAYRRGPRRGVRLERPFLAHLVYFTAAVDEDGALRLYDDPYGYDDPLAAALGMAPGVRRAAPAPEAPAQ